MNVLNRFVLSTSLSLLFWADTASAQDPVPIPPQSKIDVPMPASEGLLAK